MPTRILVVDDEPQFERLVNQRFRRKIRSGEYELAFAGDGQEALDVLEQFDADIILSDINMPRMDGLTLLDKLRSHPKTFRTIIVSAYGDMANIRKAMNLGAFDFVTKPVNFEDLQATIDKTISEVEVLQQAQRAGKLEQDNIELKELDRLKSEFFTKISHELRTPLTVINGMAEQIAENPDRWLRSGIEMIRRNGGGLLSLVNQIMDLAKLESGTLSTNLINGDVIAYLRYVTESFTSLAAAKDIELRFEGSSDRMYADYDENHLLRIVSNLLSNAIKFTPLGGSVTVEVKPIGEAYQISVRDTGQGIESDELPRVFDMFFQASGSDVANAAGTGVGLALVKELVDLMDGEVVVTSQVGKGTSFEVTLPLTNAAPRGSEDYESGEFSNSGLSDGQSDWHDNTSDLPLALIVDDTPDIIAFIQSCLDGQYRFITARDGVEGVEQAVQQVPDIIISDVMMPGKNGYELTDELKKNEVTSHIPIVLLTAKGDLDSRIEGLERGADAYLPKPFDRRELSVQLRTLLELRNALRERYAGDSELSSDSGSGQSLEDAFISRVRDYIVENIDDEQLNITALCDRLRISRTQLHNKLKALTGESATGFMRKIRLVKAKDLLKKGDFNISQVAYEVGFNDPAYFTRVFTKEFGLSPKKYRETIIS